VYHYFWRERKEGSLKKQKEAKTPLPVRLESGMTSNVCC